MSTKLEILKQIYNSFDPFEPLPAGDPLYVNCSEVRGEEDILVDVGRQITYADRITHQLYTGHRGAGKSTELLRLQADLEKQGYRVVYFAAEEADIDPEDAQYTDILLACTRNLLKNLKGNEGPIQHWLQSRKTELVEAMQTAMTQPGLTEWDEDVATSPDEEYAALVRAIRWATRFGLLFVQCTPAEGEQLIERVRADVAEKTVEALRLETEIDDLYETLAAQPGIDQTNVLFISGLEKSLTPYIQAGYGSEGDYYALDKIPKILGQLNLQRERFKERFKLCFVFLAPRYAMKYFIRRAADFFDWRSGVWEFVSPQETLQQETQRVLQEGDFQQYLNWTPQQRRERCLIIEDLIAEGDQSDEEISQLWIEQGNILMADQDYNTAIACYDQALAIKPDNSAAFYNKGTALDDLGRKEEAIACYDQALEFKPDDHLAWNNRGNALSDLGRYEAAIQSYDKALQFKPDFHLGWYNKASCYGLQGGVEETIAALQKAIELNPDYREKAKTDSDFDPIRDKAQFQAFLREQFLLGLNTSHEGGG